MNEKTNINDYSYEELIELENKMKLKIERYNMRLEAIAKQKKIQKKRENELKKQRARDEKDKIRQDKLIDSTIDMNLKETQVLSLESIEKSKDQEMYKVSLDRDSKRDKDLENAKDLRKQNEKMQQNISVTSIFDGPETEFEEPERKFKLRPLYIVIALALIIGAGSVYGYTYYKDTFRTIEDFTSLELNDVENWAVQNGVEIVRTYEYSDTIPEFSIISQSIPDGEVINRKDVQVEVVISRGPDLKKAITIDESTFVGMSYDDIVNWLDDNFIAEENREFEFVLDDEIDIEHFVSFFTEDLLTDATLAKYNRSQKFVFQISLGSESDELVDATIIDFSGMSKGEIELWLIKRRLVPNFDYDFSAEVEKNSVIDQDVEPDTTVSVGTTITIVLSLGEGIEVPDLTRMSLDEISTFAKENKVSIRQNLKYSSTIAKNDVIDQDTETGSRVKENATIEIDVSLGRVEVPNFRADEMKIDSIEAWLRSVNNFGAELRISYKEDWNDLQKNTIVSQDKSGFVNNGTLIAVTVSKGPAVDIPNFASQDEDAVNQFEEENMITIDIQYVYDHEAEGQVVDDSQSKVGKHPQGTTMDIQISKGKVPIENYSGKYKSYVQSHIDSLNASGANINLIIKYEPTVGGENDKFFSQSVLAGNYNPGFNLTVYFEKVAVVVEDFTNKAEAYVRDFCENNFLECNYNYAYSDSISQGRVIDNDLFDDPLPWGSEQVIDITLSKGAPPTINVLLNVAYEGATFEATRDAIVSDIADQLEDHGFSINPSTATYNSVKAIIPGLNIEAVSSVSKGQIDTSISSDPSGEHNTYDILDVIEFYIGEN